MSNNYNGEGHYQNSGSMARNPDSDRLASRRRSDIRYAKFYESTKSTSTDTTIRAVTPDSPGSNGVDLTALPSPTSFPSQNQIRLQDPQTSMSNTDEEGTIEGRRKKSKKKLKHKHIDTAETSPNSFFEKTRKRLNSITTASSTPARQDDSTISIGFPSVVQATVFPDLRDLKHQMPSTPRRTYSSDIATGITLSSSLRSPLVPETDSDKILKLMKTLCGRMHGILFYRPTGTASWHSGYCAINVASGSLVCQIRRGDVSSTETLVPDLRGCTVRTHYESSTQITHLSVTLPASGFGYQLRPSVPETFDSWLAALLCWQPLKPKGVFNKLAKPQSISIHDRSSGGTRRLSDIASPRSTAVVKSSQLLLWDAPLPAGSIQHESKRVKLSPYEQTSWRRVNCTLHENGTLRLLSEENAIPIRTMKLHALARCAIQRLDQSVLSAKFCIAIHPQYNATSMPGLASNPLVLSLGSRVAFEAWFVLLQAMTVPELYGPELDEAPSARPHSSDSPRSAAMGMFRIERSLQVKIVEAKFSSDTSWQDQQSGNYIIARQRPATKKGTDLYADVLLGQDLRARTICKPFHSAIFWADEFFLTDMPSMVSRVSVVFKTGNPDEREWTMTARDEYDTDDERPDFESLEVASHDPVYGRIDIPLLDLEQDSYVEKWWPILDNNGVRIGQALVRFNLEGNVVLISSEYCDLMKLLHNFDNSLTSQLGQNLGTELKQLSDILLDIFQTSDKAEDWINSLVEEEIDGIYREQPPTMRMRFSGRIHSNDSYETAEQRELLVRDLSRSATMEANLLFRGNSLVTKALDAHMRRIGRDYLERVLGDKLRALVTANPSCEVDPNKVQSNEQLERNWSNLIGHTTSIWQSIAASVSKCPPGIRQILKHIASCAEDRYGSFIRTVKYTSVSGFLFLRLFCPCILNPKLFGLLEDHPPKQTQRAFTLIAKSLIVLANLSKFGQKEPWMEPMNKFLAAATPEFKGFIEEICSWNASEDTFHEPQYQAAMQVKQRLPAASREGLPSLPFLLDAPRCLANLIDLWLDHCPANIIASSQDTSVNTFHNICLGLKQRTQECMANAEVAPEPNRNLERQWQRMLDEEPRSRIALNPFENLSADNEITALPQPPDRRYASQSFYTAPPEPFEEELDSTTPYATKGRMMSSTNSSNASLEAFNEYRNRQATRGGEGDRGRYLDISDSRRPRLDSPGAD